jgi:hypothetical protein
MVCTQQNSCRYLAKCRIPGKHCHMAEGESHRDREEELQRNKEKERRRDTDL